MFSLRTEQGNSLARRSGSGQRDACGVGHTRRWTQGRQESGHQDPSYPRSLFQCALLVCAFISLFLNTAKSQDDHTAKRQVMVTFDFSFSTRRKARRIIRRNARASMRRTARSRIYSFTHGAFDVSFVACCSQDQLLRFRRRHAFARHDVPLA